MNTKKKKWKEYIPFGWSVKNGTGVDSKKSAGKIAATIVVGPVGHQPLSLLASSRNSEHTHTLSLALSQRTQTDRRQPGSLTRCLWGFALLSLPPSPLSYNQPFGIPYPSTLFCGGIDVSDQVGGLRVSGREKT
jgi:hypothetical protein